MEEGETTLSLLTESFEKFTVINTLTASDGLGGTESVYTEGIEIMGAMPFTNSTQTKIAQAMGVKAVYKLTVRRNVALPFHTILKRNEDGNYFRVTTGGKDNQTPKTAGLDMRQYDVEEFQMGGAND